MTRTRLLTLLAIPLCSALLLSVRSRPLAAGGPDPGSLPSHATDIVVVTEADSGKQVFAQVGQLIELRLDANPSTGYMWDLSSLDGTALVVVDRLFQPLSDRPGAAGTETIRLRALRTAKMHLKLEYHRSWEIGKAPLRIFSLSLLVREGSGGLTEQVLSMEVTPTVASSLSMRAPQSASQDSNLPSAFDWRTLGGTTAVKDQGSWGMCWAFATVGVMESALKIWAKTETDLSERYLGLHNESGWSYVEGGDLAHDYHVFKKPTGEREAGAVLESDCPYTGMPDRCPGASPLRHPYMLDAWDYLPYDTDAIKQAIYRYGPVTVGVCAFFGMGAYQGGVFETDEGYWCGSALTNHVVVLVGWDDSQGSHGVWIMRNSWGVGWGESGYMRIGYGG